MRKLACTLDQMITCAKGDLLQAKVEALVNAVNIVGVMGKGIALQFRQAYPEMFRAYKAACKRGEIQTGKMYLYDNGLSDGASPRWIINFPTKKHWKDPSQMEYVESGLKDLADTIVRLQIRSIAVPALGCGNGGLSWGQVRPVIEEALGTLPGVDVLLYGPERAV